MDRLLWCGKRVARKQGWLGAGGRVPRRFERGESGRPGFVGGWVGCMLALALTLPASGQPTFTGERPEGEGRVKRVERVVGRQDTTHATYPWQVAVINRGESGSETLCGGSLIAAEWVLTAAHCVTQYSTTRLWPRQRFEIRHETDNWRDRDGATRRGVAEIHMHPQYDGDATHGNDIALLRLSLPMDSKRSYGGLLVEQSGASAFVFSGACAVVTGWGLTREGDSSSSPNQLQAANLAILDQRECRQAYGAGKISDGEVCAGVPGGGLEACQGDGGGPLVVEGLAGKRRPYVLAGVVSWGEGCGRAGKPGVYARVSHYMPWILRIVGGG